MDSSTPEEGGLPAFFCLMTVAVPALFHISYVAFALPLCILLVKFFVALFFI